MIHTNEDEPTSADGVHAVGAKLGHGRRAAKLELATLANGVVATAFECEARVSTNILPVARRLCSLSREIPLVKMNKK